MLFMVKLASLHRTCNSRSIRKFAFPQKECKMDYSTACKIFIQTLEETVLDIIWQYFDQFYILGLLPDKVCEKLKRCNPNTTY